MAKRKTHWDDSSLLLDFLRDEGYGDLVDQIPIGATLLRLKNYIAGTSLDHCGLPLDVLNALRGSLSEPLSWEKTLHSKCIAFCSSASRESDLHRNTSRIALPAKSNELM